MKKLLLTVIALVVTLAVTAQTQKTDDTQLTQATRRQLNTRYLAAPISQSNTQTRAAKRKSKDTGLYYQLEEGTLYVSVNDEGLSHYETSIIVPPFSETTFYNMSTNPLDTKWYMNGMDYTSYADDKGDITTYIVPGNSIDTDGTIVYYAYYYPFDLYNATMTDYFVFGENSDTYQSLIGCGRTTDWLAFCDDKSGYGGGRFDNGNIMGAGTYTDSEGTIGDEKIGAVYQSIAVGQDFPAPRASMYVDKVTLAGCTIGTGATALDNGAELTLSFYKTSNDELIETLTATEDDVTYYDEGFRGIATGMQYVRFATITFKKWESNPLFGLMEAPFTIPAEPFYAVIDGFDNDGVNFGVSVFDSYYWDRGLTAVYDYVKNIDGSSDPYAISYGTETGCPYVLGLSFESMMDYVEVEAELQSSDGSITFSNCNIIKISDDGTECHTYGVTPNGMTDLQWLYVMTACEWFDEEGSENYYIADDDDYDWIIGYDVYADDYSDDNQYYFNCLYFQAEALPAGITGRAAAFRIQGRGTESSNIVYILQGDATPADANGIQNVANAQQVNAKTGTYNLAGQRVTDTTRGLIIKDGKKIINK